jgi:hypothetical protein
MALDRDTIAFPAPFVHVRRLARLFISSSSELRVTMRALRVVTAIFSMAAIIACGDDSPTGGTGEGAGNTGGSPSTGGAGAGPSTGGNGDGGTPSEGGSGDGGMPGQGGCAPGEPGTADVVINEIDANVDWIELHNNGVAAFDLSGLVLADRAADCGPKIEDAIIFPPATMIEPGAKLFILAKQDGVVSPGEQVPQTQCAPGLAPCFYAPFGLSNGDGDEIFLIDGGDVLASAVYPSEAATEPATWCRIPDGTGDFAACTATPSAVNDAL